MARFARFDPSSPHDTKPVLGWYDTDALTYRDLPPEDQRVEVSAEQWEERLHGFFGVRDGKLVGVRADSPIWHAGRRRD